jgi:hypothetical protein
VLDPASLTAYELSARVERMMTTLGERLTHLDREVLREAVRRAGERDGVVEALLDRNCQWGPQPERNRLLEEVAEAALALRRGERDAGRRLDTAPARLREAPNPGRGWLARRRCGWSARRSRAYSTGWPAGRPSWGRWRPGG